MLTTNGIRICPVQEIRKETEQIQRRIKALIYNIIKYNENINKQWSTKPKFGSY